MRERADQGEREGAVLKSDKSFWMRLARCGMVVLSSPPDDISSSVASSRERDRTEQGSPSFDSRGGGGGGGVSALEKREREREREREFGSECAFFSLSLSLSLCRTVHDKLE